MFRVVSRRSGLSGHAQTMGRGVLPLDLIVSQTSKKKFTFSFRVRFRFALMSVVLGILGGASISFRSGRQDFASCFAFMRV